MQTTLNKIRSHSPCESGWVKLLKNLGKTQADDEPLDFLTIIESNGLDDALWCLKAAPIEWQSNIRMYTVWCAKQIEHLMTDDSKNALVVAQNHALGLATDAELKAAADVAWAVAEEAARAAWYDGLIGDEDGVTWAAARAAWVADADAASAALDAAGADDAYATWTADDDQTKMFIKMCKGTAPWQRSMGENLLPITVLLEEV